MKFLYHIYALLACILGFQHTHGIKEFQELPLLRSDEHFLTSKTEGLVWIPKAAHLGTRGVPPALVSLRASAKSRGAQFPSVHIEHLNMARSASAQPLLRPVLRPVLLLCIAALFHVNLSFVLTPIPPITPSLRLARLHSFVPGQANWYESVCLCVCLCL
jgi:hypothetical protein